MLSRSFVPDSITQWTEAHQAPLFTRILQARILEWVPMPSSRGSSQTQDWTLVSINAGRYFTIWTTKEAQEYWVGSLFLLQWVFPAQELNWSLPHCRQIFYQLSYQGSPKKQISVFKYRYQLRQNNHSHILKSNYCNVPILCYSGLCLTISVTRVDCFSRPEMIDSQ